MVSAALSMILAVSVLSGCTGSGAQAGSAQAQSTQAASAQAGTGSAAGGEVSVLLPEWSDPGEEAIASFEKQSGIKVNLNIMGWDQIHDKVTIAAASKESAADVLEVDWSWAKEFITAGVVDPITLTDAEKKTFPLYTAFDVGGQISAIPYMTDYKVGYYNTEHFEKAGITKAPETWDELIADCKKIKDAGVCKYPMAFTLSATEGNATQFLWLTLARTGAVFNADNSLQQANLQDSFSFISKALKDEIIDPAAISMQDTEVDKLFKNGDASFIIASTTFMETANNAEESKVVGKVAPMLIPGNKDIKSATFGLPEGLGISKNSTNKANAKAFIDWYLSVDTQISNFGKQGALPSNMDAFKKLGDEKKILGAEVIEQQSDYLTTPFPNGVPSWYSEYTTSAAQYANGMAQGSITPEQAAEKLAEDVKGFNAE